MSEFTSIWSGAQDALDSVFGDPFTHTPAAGDPQTVTLRRRDPATLEAVSPGVFAILEGKDSQFLTPIAVNDLIDTYRVIGVRRNAEVDEVYIELGPNA